MQAAEIVAKASHLEIVDNENTSVGAEIVDDLLTHVPMSLFKMMGAIFSIEFRSYIMIRNTMKHFADASCKSDILHKVFEGIQTIPADERFHVEYTAKFLENELAQNPEKYDDYIDQLAESMKHAGGEMCIYMDHHKSNVDEEGGLAALTSIF